MNNPASITIETTFALSRFQSIKDNSVQPCVYSWKELPAALGRHQVQISKDGPCWSPNEYRPQATRGNKGVVSLSMAVLDIDDGTPYETIRDLFSGIAHIAYSTFRHKTAHPKYRVVIPLAEAVRVEDWPVFWTRLNEKADGHLDTVTKDPARIYYLPSHPPGEEESCFWHESEGRFLTLADLPAAPIRVGGDLIPAAELAAVGKTLAVVAAPQDQTLGTPEELAAVVERCTFMQWASDPATQPQVKEPLWMAMISNACRFDDREWIHQASNAHPDFDAVELDKRIDRHRDASPPVTCKAIQELGYSGCPKGGCRLPSGKATKAPAGLRTWSKQQTKEAVLTKENPLGLGRAFAQAAFQGLIRYAHNSFSIYREGCWDRVDEEHALRQRLIAFLERYEVSVTSGLLDEVVKLLKDDLYGAWDAEPRRLICLVNGTLDPESGQLGPHNPEHKLRSRLPIVWDEASTCPKWEQTVLEIFAWDPDKDAKIALLQEWFGYCLVPDTQQHKFLWLVGGGGNGKSLVLDVLAAIIGEDNISHAQLERLDRAPVRAELEGKLVNISSEMSPDATVGDGYLKQIVAGDPIEADRKYEPSFSFKPFCRLIGATNELPRLLDQSHGFARRALFLTFNRRFTEAEQNRNLMNELRAELPGILAWSVRGLQRLRTQGSFTIPPSAKTALGEYRKESDAVQLFLEEGGYESSQTNTIEKRTLYRDFRDWCQENGFNQLNISTFGKRLTAIGIGELRKSNSRMWRLSIKARDVQPALHIVGAGNTQPATEVHYNI